MSAQASDVSFASTREEDDEEEEEEEEEEEPQEAAAEERSDRWEATCSTCGHEGDLLCCEVRLGFCGE